MRTNILVYIHPTDPFSLSFFFFYMLIIIINPIKLLFVDFIAYIY